MVKSKVKVYIRTRPTGQPFQGFKIDQDNGSVQIEFNKAQGNGQPNNHINNLAYKFDGVLHNDGQESVYNTSAYEVVGNVLSGLNGSIFCYGQTGAGKTFTMSGDPMSYQRRGIIPRSLNHMFKEMALRVDRQYQVHVTYLEIYNEQLYDLLADQAGSGTDLHVLEEGGVVQVKGLTSRAVQTEQEALGYFFSGEQARCVSQHALNHMSSRSHCIFTVHVDMRASADSQERALLSKLNLVDLAGCERTKKSGVTGQLMKEANYINRSLTFLEQTVNALSRRDGHVPYRHTKLTEVLQDALGGNCRTVMIATIWPEADHVEETVAVLRFAARVRMISTAAVLTESTDPKLALKRYERIIRELKTELAMRDTLSGRGRMKYDDLSDGERAELTAEVVKFLDGEIETNKLPLDTMRKIYDILNITRGLYLTAKSDIEQLNVNVAQNNEPNAQNASSEKGTTGSDPRVGDVVLEGEDAKGMYIGIAAEKAKPADISTHNPMPESRIQSPVLIEGRMRSAEGATTKAEAFEQYKKTVDEGRKLSDNVKAKQIQTRQIKQQMKELQQRLGELKQEIDTANVQLQQARDVVSGDKGEGVIDGDEYQILAQLKSAKQQYRLKFDEFNSMRTQHEEDTQNLLQNKQTLLQKFEDWLNDTNHTAAEASGLQVAQESNRYVEVEEEFERLRLERNQAIDPDSHAYFAAKRFTQKIRPLDQKAFGGDKGRSVQLKRLHM